MARIDKPIVLNMAADQGLATAASVRRELTGIGRDACRNSAPVDSMKDGRRTKSDEQVTLRWRPPAARRGKSEKPPARGCRSVLMAPIRVESRDTRGRTCRDSQARLPVGLAPADRSCDHQTPASASRVLRPRPPAPYRHWHLLLPPQFAGLVTRSPRRPLRPPRHRAYRSRLRPRASRRKRPDSSPCPATRLSDANTRAAKPAEGRQAVRATSGTARPRLPGSPSRPTSKGKLSGFRSLKIDVEQTGMDQRQLLTFNSLGADPQIGITLARRNRTEALVWGLALAVFVLGMALTTRPVRQKAALVLGLATGLRAVAPGLGHREHGAALQRGVLRRQPAGAVLPGRGTRPLDPPRAARPGGPDRRPGRRLPRRSFWPWSLLFSATAQAQPPEARTHAEREEHLPPVVVPGDAIIVPYDVKSKTGVQDADHCWSPTTATSSFGTWPIPTRRSTPTPLLCPTPSRARPTARCSRARKR